MVSENTQFFSIHQQWDPMKTSLPVTNMEAYRYWSLNRTDSSKHLQRRFSEWKSGSHYKKHMWSKDGTMVKSRYMDSANTTWWRPQTAVHRRKKKQRPRTAQAKRTNGFTMSKDAHRDQYFKQVNEYSKAKDMMKERAQAMLLNKVAKNLETESDMHRTHDSRKSQEVLLSWLSFTKGYQDDESTRFSKRSGWVVFSQSNRSSKYIKPGFKRIKEHIDNHITPVAGWVLQGGISKRTSIDEHAEPIQGSMSSAVDLPLSDITRDKGFWHPAFSHTDDVM